MAASGTLVRRERFGTLAAGMPVECFTLESDRLTAKVITFGARLISVAAPDREGKHAEVVLGSPRLEDYVSRDKGYLGATVGRYANRIDGGRFRLEGREFQITQNDKGNALHGGVQGFDRRVWKARVVDGGVELTLLSPDGDQGFPGALEVSVTYTLVGTRLRIEYSARAEKTTVVCLTNHAYFNLAGEGGGDILSHELQLNAGFFTPVNERLIPTGELRAVEGTAFDFRVPAVVGARIAAADEQLALAGGYDHNWVLDGPAGGMKRAAKLVDHGSGRSLEVQTTEPGVQFYTGNFLAGEVCGWSGEAYARRAGLCLETQKFPDSPNHPRFPTCVLQAGAELQSETVYEFGVDG